MAGQIARQFANAITSTNVPKGLRQSEPGLVRGEHRSRPRALRCYAAEPDRRSAAKLLTRDEARRIDNSTLGQRALIQRRSSW
jgi:hypothetical protein